MKIIMFAICVWITHAERERERERGEGCSATAVGVFNTRTMSSCGFLADLMKNTSPTCAAH